MRKMKSLGKGSLLKSLLRALGMDRGSSSSLLAQAEAQFGVSADFVSYHFQRKLKSALLEAEQAKAKAIMELRRQRFFQ